MMSLPQALEGRSQETPHHLSLLIRLLAFRNQPLPYDYKDAQ